MTLRPSALRLHFESSRRKRLLAVDTFVNDAILRGIPVVTEVLPIEEAKKKGAVAMFGEKYGDVVRVVEMGDVSMGSAAVRTLTTPPRSASST